MAKTKNQEIHKKTPSIQFLCKQVGLAKKGLHAHREQVVGGAWAGHASSSYPQSHPTLPFIYVTARYWGGRGSL